MNQRTTRRSVYWLLRELNIPAWRINYRAQQQTKIDRRQKQLKEKFPWVDFTDTSSGRPHRTRVSKRSGHVDNDKGRDGLGCKQPTVPDRQPGLERREHHGDYLPFRAEGYDGEN